MSREPLNASVPFAVVVNNDPTQLQMLAGLLCKAGLEPWAFTGAEAALEAMSVDAPPALIVTDLYMPGLDGWRFCRLLRSPEYAAFNRIPILVLSATFAGAEASRIAADLGAEAFLPSPVDHEHFCELVQVILRGGPVRNRLRVLIVDDNAPLCDLLKEVFESQGYEVRTAFTARAATAVFKQTPFDVAVLDFHLPDGSGDALLSEFRGLRPDCVCLMMTADPGPELALQWMKRGAAAYLHKPFKPDYLIELCARARRERALLRVQELLEVRTRELRASEERFRNLLQDVPAVAVQGYGMDGITTYWNQASEQLYGYTAQEAIGRSLFDLIIPPEMREGVRQAIQQMAETEQPIPASELSLMRKEGSRVDVFSYHAIVRIPGRATELFCLDIDLTERKQAEEALRNSENRYRGLVELAVDGILLTSAAGVIIEANQCICELAGISRADLIGRNIRDLPFTRECPERNPFPFDLLQQGQPVVTEQSVVRSDGSEVVLEMRTKIMPDGTYQSIYRDITERRRAEAERDKLEDLKRQLQKSASLGRMAGAIAHHFNNQLQAVTLNLEAVIHSQAPGKAPTENLSEAMQSVRKAAEVSTQLLTYLGQSHGKRAPMDLSDVCRRGLSLPRAVMPKSVVLKIDLSSPGPSVSVDANQIQQVLTSLLTNAWEASEAGHGTVLLTVKTVSAAEISTAHRFPVDWQAQDTAYACLEVKDTGSGIPNEDIEKIFDPFFSTKFAGRGLGLAVALGIVRAHQGAVTVKSERGRGSVFQVFLPVSAEAAPRQPVQERQVPTTGRGNTVLIVEDEPTVRKAATLALGRDGFSVLAAADGVEALEIFRLHRNEIGCVVCDLTMPRMDGWQTLTALRRLAPGLPVILASGFSETQVMEGEHPERPQLFLHKPYELKDLREAIRQVLVNWRN